MTLWCSLSRNCTPHSTKLRGLNRRGRLGGSPRGGPFFCCPHSPKSKRRPMATVPLTRRGAEKLKQELQRLKSVERPSVINAIAEARAQGDLSENAEYEAA